MDRRNEVVSNIQYGGLYADELEEAERTGICPFCNPEFRSRNKIFAAGGEWFAVRNQFPTRDREGGYPEHQFLFVSFAHKDGRKNLEFSDYTDIETLRRMIDKEFGIDGGCLFIRMGSSLRSGRTIIHAHAHYYVPRVEDDPHNPGKKKAIPVYIPAG